MTANFSGMPAAPGIGLGPAYVHRSKAPSLDVIASMARSFATQHDPDDEWRHFLAAQAEVEAELQVLGQSLNTIAADIFAVHQVILHDKTLTESVRDAIYLNRGSAAAGTQLAIQNMAEIFRDMEDEYFASRAADIVDIGKRLLIHLGVDLQEVSLSHAPIGSILISDDLTPSDIAQLSNKRVSGIALAESTPTAHSSILARSLGLPLVCGLGYDVLLIENGRQVALDGDRGRLIVQPNSQQVTRYRDAFDLQEAQREIALQHVHEQAVTVDGVSVPVCINVNQPEEVAQGRLAGADGVGLLRTEYLFQSRVSPPTREEQGAIYQGFVDELGRLPLTVRALDAGGDKPVEFLPAAVEENPFLGRRGIRLLLDHPEILVEQYQALLDVAAASAHAHLRYMLPMVSTVEEVSIAQRILAKASDAMEMPPDARAQNQARVKIGALIEVPSAALLADQLAAKVDFFSIGTNDLAQYVMASDRTNSAVAKLADPLHPAVLHLIGHVCRVGKESGLPVSLCGEMAGNPHAVPLLLGLGVTELSVPLPCVPLVKQVVRECDLARCRQLAIAARQCAGVDQVRDLLTTF